jgi:hypothetical protein
MKHYTDTSHRRSKIEDIVYMILTFLVFAFIGVLFALFI